MSASKPLKSFNQHIVDKLNDLLTKEEKDCLYSWSNLADRKHMGVLFSVIKKHREVQPYEKSYTAYRGMGLDPRFQETLGLYTRGIFVRKIKEADVGYTFKRKIEFPVSTTTDINIAKAFGDLIVETTVSTKNKTFLHFTPELTMVRHIHAKIHKDHDTQDELVLMPDEYVFKVVRV